MSFFTEMFYPLDIVCAVFVLLVMMSGLCRGLSGELALLLTLLFLLGAFYFFYPPLSQGVVRHFGEKFSVRVLRVGVALFLGLSVFILSFPLHLLLRKMMKISMGVLPDKIWGAAMGLVFGLVIGISFFLALSLAPSEKIRTFIVEKSAIGGWVSHSLTPWVYPRLMGLPLLDSEEG